MKISKPPNSLLIRTDFSGANVNYVKLYECEFPHFLLQRQRSSYKDRYTLYVLVRRFDNGSNRVFYFVRFNFV